MARINRLLTASILALGSLAAFSLLLRGNSVEASAAVVSRAVPAAYAASAQEVLCVAVEGGGPYVGCSTVYTDVQAAVDAARDGEVIKIASGVYTGVHARPAPSGYHGPAVISQVVFISKSVTLLGGYTVTNWIAPHPVTQPVTLNAQGRGRGVVANGDIAVAMVGLQITGGTAFGLNKHGGGVYVSQAAVLISNSHIYSNTTGDALWEGRGGGLYADECSSLTLLNSTVLSNTAVGDFGSGAGLHAWCKGEIVIAKNVVAGNHGRLGESEVGTAGGGIVAGSTGGHTTVVENVISNNDPLGPCGGLVIGSNATVRDNLIAGNTAAYFGGGLCVWNGADNALVERNSIIHNQVLQRDERGGGGVWVRSQGDVVFANNLVADNELGGEGQHGAGIEIESECQCSFLHTTIARNVGGDGRGIYVESAGSVIYLTNTILVGHSAGIQVSAGSTATLEATLWGTDTWANGIDWVGEGTILTGTINVLGDPSFVDPDAGDYHIGPDSAAIDAGVDAGVNTDIDGEQRPIGQAFDIGADETGPSLVVGKQATPQVVQPGTRLTYTIHVTNSGTLSLTTTISDVLPDHVLPTGVLTWTPTIPLLEVWTETVVVTTEAGYFGPLVNVVQVTTEEGASGVYTHTLAPSLELVKRSSSDVVQAGEQLTYTIWVTNSGDYPLHATITDVLPVQVTPRQPLTWTAMLPAPNGVWSETVAVTANWGYAGPLVNRVEVATDEGVRRSYTETVMAGVSPALSVTARADRDSVSIGERLTYTIEITNTGNVTLTTTITDVLPTQVTPSGVLAWTTVLPVPGGVWTQTVPVTVVWTLGGPLLNTVRAAADEGAVGADEVIVNVINPPVADAGPDQTVNTSALVTLDGSGSNDPDGDLPLTYLWSQIDGPPVAFTANSSVTTFTAPSDPAVLTFTLAVTDSLGLPDLTPDEVAVTVDRYRIHLPLVMRLDKSVTARQDTHAAKSRPGGPAHTGRRIPWGIAGTDRLW